MIPENCVDAWWNIIPFQDIFSLVYCLPYCRLISARAFFEKWINLIPISRIHPLYFTWCSNIILSGVFVTIIGVLVFAEGTPVEKGGMKTRTRTSIGTPPSAKSTRTVVTRERKESPVVDEGGVIYKSRLGKHRVY